MSLVYAICGNPDCVQEFVPQPRYDAKRKTMTTTQFCSSKCWSAVRVRRGISVDTSYAKRARIASAARKLDEKFAVLFGELSERERQMVRIALRRGYDRGYQSVRGTSHRTKDVA